jgi:hypothetical protein
MCAAGAESRKISSAEKFVLILVVAVQLMIAGVYGITPYDPDWHLATSLTRLMFLPVLLTLALLIDGLEKISGIDA